MSGSSFQLTTFLYGLGGGRRRIPPAPAVAPQQTGFISNLPGPVELGGVESTCLAVQQDATSCGSAAGAVALSSINPAVAGWLQGETQDLPDKLIALSGVPAQDRKSVKARFNWLQQNLKVLSNRRSLWPFHWPSKAGTPPWGAAQIMTKGSGVKYLDRMVVNTSMRQRTRTLTAAAVAADLGYPVLLYVGGDSSGGWNTSVPRHVVVLHAGQEPAKEGFDGAADHLDVEARLTKMAAEMKERLKAVAGQEFDPALVIYEPAFGNNFEVTVAQLTGNAVPAAALGGWPHVVWMVLPVLTKGDTR